MGLGLIRVLFFLLGALAGFILTRSLYGPWLSLFAGLAVGLALVTLAYMFERRLKLQPFRVILGGVLGLMAGLVLGRFLYQFLLLMPGLDASAFHLELIARILFGYLGLSYGVRRAEDLDLKRLRQIITGTTPASGAKVLDTSAIIDGRIADVLDTRFLQGTMVIPQFVLKELQHIADSPDPLKRNRGRRGLDILQKIKRMVDVRVEVSELDAPELREVDAKLIEVAKILGAAIVTTDFNLNKVAELQGIEVLNINDLANAVKPVVLPGEEMRVQILKEGKEYGQGVGYLDDGTMVVVDNARSVIGQNVDVSVTSVLQTTAGRMIFGRLRPDGGGGR